MPAVKTSSDLTEICQASRDPHQQHRKRASDGFEVRAYPTRFPDIPLFVVNRSRYIAKLPDDGLTLFDLFSLG